ncbi:mucin-5AC isoform X2 [Zeugodacus cucurbitae]|uniref:mucin-5AC isoform X2 n=1 Tax=Zeugodacus cucurbitae TaxID=28588 RepID=UPI000596AC0D|nr:mucin-5AC isoform X2 [Zeugodacus cucurbitae]
MLLEFLKYATRLLKNNMTTIILATTTASATTTTTPTLNISTNLSTATTTTISNIANNISAAFATSALSPTHNGMLPEQPATTQPTLETFNSTLKTLFNKTLANVAQTNLSDYTTPHTLLSPLSNGPGVDGDPLAGGGGAATVMSALPTLPVSRYAMEATTSLPAAQTVATIMAAAGSKNRATIIVYPTVSPESIVIPIVSCIFGFPILALLVICCLRRRAKLARERDRRRNYDMQDHAVSLITDRRELSVYVLNEA